MRSAVLDVIRLDYVTTARAKGLAERAVIAQHVVRNALIPVVTLVALQMPAVFGGAIVTEQIFRIPGIGSLLISSILANDTPVIMAVTFVFACLVILFNLIADILYGWLDPRIAYRYRRDRSASAGRTARLARQRDIGAGFAGTGWRWRAPPILVLMMLAVALGPLLWQVPINDIDFSARLAGPSWAHPFGTDDLGQDLLARMLYGGRISLSVGLSAMLVAVVVGTIIGAIAGISRGGIDVG